MFTFVLMRVIAVILLVAANAFFAAGEYALVSIRDTRLQQLIDQGRIGARTIRKLHNKLDEVLNGIQIGVTMASLALGWIGEESMAHVLEVPLARLPHSAFYAHALASIFAFTTITYLHVILGEVVPKSIALQKAEHVALAVAGPLDVFITIFSPVTRTMAASSRFVLRSFGWSQIREGGVHTPEELKLSVTASHRYGLISALQQDLLHRALDLEQISVREIMVPRPDIFSIPGDMPLEEAIVKVVEEQHSRIPVYDPARGPEAIIGVLYSKDLMRWMQFRLKRGQSSSSPAPALPTLSVRHIMRDVLVVPETKALPDLLSEFKHRRRHLAIVVDEYGSTAGLVTVEDVLEQLVGEIEDEFDIVPRANLGNPASLVLDAALNIRDLESQYNLHLPRDEGFETLAGFAVAQLQRIPKAGDSFLFQQRRFTVVEMEGRRVGVVKVDLVPNTLATGSEAFDTQAPGTQVSDTDASNPTRRREA
ncbi:MAG TPA: hemolysin family protein [Candidatus Saccharimonadales bacterium]|nr:hemolysin family protein [Candidatus Saccharimonadales bacterium]